MDNFEKKTNRKVLNIKKSKTKNKNEIENKFKQHLILLNKL
jgi:hypothetical protein